MGPHVGMCAWRQVPMAIGLDSLELESAASCELPNAGAENPTQVLWESSKCSNCRAASHANNTVLLVMFLITIQSDEFPYSIFIHTVFALHFWLPPYPLTSVLFLLNPLQLTSLLLSCYKYSIILLLLSPFCPSAQISLFPFLAVCPMPTLTHIHICLT